MRRNDWAFHIKDDGKWQFLDVGGRGLAQRQGRSYNDAVPALEILEVPVNFHPTATRLDAGERLVVLLSCGDTEWYHTQDPRPTFLLEHGSRLLLPSTTAGSDPGLNTTTMTNANPYFRGKLDALLGVYAPCYLSRH